MPRRSEKLIDGQTDIGLKLLLCVTSPGETRTQEEIAFVCGCTTQNIQNIERRALRKLRVEFERRGIDLAEIL